MDPAHATEALWVDPLSYNYLKDGPPYLPGIVGGKVASDAKAEVRAWVRQASAEVGGDVAIAFQHCVAEYGGAPMSELAVLLACVRAEAMIHQAHHWQTRGSSYYGDHLLFERVYGEVNGAIDGLAERAVGSGHHVLVQPLMQMSHMVVFTKLFYSDAPVSPEPEEMPLLSLRALLKSMLLLQLAYESLQARGLLSNGTDNLLQDLADKQESLAYLLKQRTKTRNANMTPKTALAAFTHELMIRRVASRFVEAMEHDSPEALKQYLKDHPNADKSKHKVKKDEEGGGSKSSLSSKDLDVFEKDFAFMKNMRKVVRALKSGSRPTEGALKKAVGELKRVLDDYDDAIAQEKDPDELQNLKGLKATVEKRLQAVEKLKPRKDISGKWPKAVREIAESNLYDLGDDDAEELKDFKERKPSKGKPLTDQQLMQKFLRAASPETRERMKGMSVDDFKAMYDAIMDEEG